MEKPRRRRPILRGLAIGCGVLALLVAVLGAWIGSQIYQATRQVEVSDHHPFRSPAKKERYLAHLESRAESWPSPSTDLTVDTSWGGTFVRVNGPAEGPPMVLLPGANATSLMWEPNVEAFSRDHRVYVVDNIFDVGRSVYTRNLEAPADYVGWLEDLFDGLGLGDDIRLVGLSYGGWIAAQYALEHPERLESLVLLAPAGTVLGLSADFIKRGVLCMIPHKHFVRSMVRWALADAAAGDAEERRVVDEAVDDAWLSLRSFKPRSQVHPTVLTDQELRSLATPTLFLVGENEVIYSGSAVDAVSRLNSVAPQITTEILPDCGHDLTLVQTEVVNRRVLEFLGSPTKSVID